MLGQVHDPDLHLLRLFVTVVEAGGFSAAQGVLGLSQPTISQRMAQLEHAWVTACAAAARVVFA